MKGSGVEGAGAGLEERAACGAGRAGGGARGRVCLRDLERQQLGMASPFARAGRWSDLERGAAAFAAWYAERLTRP